MKALWATYLRELRAYFVSPLAYVVAFFFLVVNGFIFAWMVSVLNDPRAPSGPPMGYFFGSTWLLLIGLGMMLPMRLVAEEMRSGSIETLMTAPISETQVVAGKYLAVLTFYVSLWVPTFAYPAILARFGDVQWGPIASGYLGLFLVGALFLAIGTFASAMTRSQLVAAIITFAILIVLFLIGQVGELVNGEALKTALSYIDLGSHLDEMAKGIVDTRRLVYFTTTTLFFLFLTSRALADRKWR